MGKYLFKIIIAGSPESQKTELLNRYTTGQFNSDTKMTIGVDFAVHYQDLEHGNGTATLQIWDFGGEERFRTMLPSFCQGSSGALLLFDLLNPKTFDDLDEWMHIIRRNTQNIPILLCGLNHSIKNPKDFAVSQLNIKDFLIHNDIDGYLSLDMDSELNVISIFNELTNLMVISDSRRLLSRQYLMDRSSN